MSAIDCFANGSRLKNQVVVITGAASGIGRQVSLLFSSYGAKMVMGDVNLDGLKVVAGEIKKKGGKCVFIKCDVTKWEDQVAMFELATKTYGQVDVVCPNAGITEAAPFEPITSKDGKLLQPDYLTLNITLIGAIHTSVLALHFFANQPTSATSSLKSLVITGSMASFTGVGGNAPPAPLYSVSKAGKLGLVQGLRESCREDGVRVSLINPFFTKTKILPDGFEVDERIGFAKIEDVASAFLAAATDPDMKTSGSAYTIPDSRGVLRLLPPDLQPKGFGGMKNKVRSVAGAKVASKL